MRLACGVIVGAGVAATGGAQVPSVADPVRALDQVHAATRRVVLIGEICRDAFADQAAGMTLALDAWRGRYAPFLAEVAQRRADEVTREAGGDAAKRAAIVARRADEDARRREAIRAALAGESEAYFREQCRYFPMLVYADRSDVEKTEAEAVGNMRRVPLLP